MEIAGDFQRNLIGKAVFTEFTRTPVDTTNPSDSGFAAILALTKSGIPSPFEAFHKLAVPRSGVSSPASYDDIGSVGRSRSSTTVCDFDNIDTEELSEDGHDDSITPPSWIPLDDLPQANYTDSDLQAHDDYWIKALEDAPVQLDLPTDHPRSIHRSSTDAQVSICFGASLASSVRSLAKEHEVDLDVILMAGWSTVLSRLSRQDDIVIGVRAKDASHIDNSSILDNNILPQRVDLSGDPNTTQLLERVRRATMSAKAHQGLPLRRILSILEPASGDRFTMPFQVIFQWYEQERTTRTKPTSTTFQVDLELNLQDSGEEIVGELRFATALFEFDTIKRHVGYLQAILGFMASDQARPVAAFDLISTVEKSLLEKMNGASATFHDHLCMHQLFEIQAESTPNAVAVVIEDEKLTYGELNSRANRLAHQLIKLGVKPDTRVAICVERSLAMVTGPTPSLALHWLTSLDECHLEKRLLGLWHY
ncbi:hypothetical protein BGX34_005900 [Mortierella sp. NVP85]|nr:hypothetical protein BGX34_005900 [Mortierella sp. NVP85]